MSASVEWQLMSNWEVAGVLAAVAIGAAVGAAYVLMDSINKYLNWDPLQTYA